MDSKTCSRQRQQWRVSANTVGSVVIAVLLVVTYYEAIRPLANPTLSGTIGQIAKTDTSLTEGWHSIHVFYGNRSALLGGTNRTNAVWFSQVRQDEIVVDLLGDKTSGYFIDLAANDAWDRSNTLALEKRGWEGLCIEPNPTYWFGLSHRKCTVVGALIGEKVEQVNVTLRGAFGGISSLMNHRLAGRMKAPKAEAELRYKVPLIDVFERFHVPKLIDYMSLDVEGAEYLVMKDFPFDKYRVKLMTVERPTPDLEWLLTNHGYVNLTILVKWGETLWAHKSTGITPDDPKVKSIVMLPE